MRRRSEKVYAIGGGSLGMKRLLFILLACAGHAAREETVLFAKKRLYKVIENAGENYQCRLLKF